MTAQSPVNVDDRIAQDMNARMNQQAPVQPAQNPINPEPVREVTEREQKPLEAPKELENVTAQEVPRETPEINAPEEKPKTDNPIDEYGNPVEKERTYSESEVQAMIRDRLSRGRHAEQPTQQQVKQAAEEFKTDPNSEESWETQLEAFVEKTIEKRQTKLSEKQWQEQERAKQADFEAKFSAGMTKYQDFRQVVAGKPITDSMMMAARSLDNPAAFVYGAAKMHPQELDRIARIADPYTQAAEIGRLHERMVKGSKQTSTTPRPIEAPKGDMSAKHTYQPSLEQRILEHARSKRK